MPGIPTHFLLVDKSNDRLNIAQTNLGYAYLGAIGPSLGDFIPNSDPGSGMPDRTKYWEVWNLIFSLVFGYDPGDPKKDGDKPPLLDLLVEIQTTLDLLEAAVGPRDVGKLKSLNDSGQLDKFQQAAKDLAKFATLLNFDPNGLTGPIGQLIFDSINFKPDSNNKPPAPPDLFVRDLLHSRRTGTFLRLLQEKAADDKLKAYALGYLTSYAGKVCGNPFINSIVGGPYRTQWWRHRWISNYVDAWTFGFYSKGASMSVDTPTPPYAEWPSLCDANLHKKLSDAFGQNNPFANLDVHFVMDVLRGKQELPDDKKLPPSFCKYWFEAMSEAYGELAPGWIAEADDGRRQLVLTHAFLQLWIVLWFQTGSGVQGLGCPPALPDKMPTQCGTMPAWDGPGTQGQGSAQAANPPPVPRPETEHDVGLSISGLVAILAGAVLFYASEGLLGAGAIAGGVDLLLNEETSVNWDGLECSLYWYRWYHYGFCDGLHQILTRSGFSFPYAKELDRTLFDHEGNPISIGLDRIKSKTNPFLKTDNFFPAQQPKTLSQLAGWLVPPNTGPELPSMIGYLDAAYPSFFVDDPANGLGPANARAIYQTPGIVNDANLFKRETNVASRTGNAIANIHALFKHIGDFTGEENDFPQWNLDGDRGMYFWTWQFRDAYDTTQIEVAD